MKKIFFTLFSLLIVGCGSYVTTHPLPTTDSKPANRIFEGDWTLESVTHNQKGSFDIILMNDTNRECFEGSSWNFVPSNNRGSYQINSNDCSKGERNFVFVIQKKEPSGYYEFLLTPTNEKYQTETNNGISLRLVYLSEKTMIWEQTMDAEGKPFVVSMNFVK